MVNVKTFKPLPKLCFASGGIRNVDQDLESNAGPRVEKEPGARSVISLSDGSKEAAYC